jgi:hypothetical protein
MSTSTEEAPITARVSERPRLDPSKLKHVRPRDLAVRFLAGAATSVVAGIVSVAAGPRVGGFFLAFPAILGASLTLIEKQEDRAQAREDCRGAVLGGGAMTVFAAVVALTVEHMNGAVALALAAAAWLAGALGGYLIAWYR